MILMEMTSLMARLIVIVDKFCLSEIHTTNS